MAWLVEFDLYNSKHFKEMKMTKLRSTLAFGALLSAGAFAQELHQGVGPIGFAFQGGDFVYMRTEGGMDNKIVKNSPYSAQSVTEFTQTLADGNRIHRTTSGSIARDSEGRTRREQAMTAIGQMSGSTESVKSVMIQDPVSGISYTLEPHSHAARVSHNTAFKFTLNKDGVESVAKEKLMAEAMAKLK